MNGLQGDRHDRRPRCESCRRPLVGAAFRIYWRDEVFFDVCEACAPLPDEKYHVHVVDYSKERERMDEQSD